jgi:ferredoxin/flavodoxin---NADP+ reductase
MFKILLKKELSPTVKEFVMDAPLIARNANPGQFVILRINELGERIPLTIADFDREQGTITLIFQELGHSTRALGLLQEGEAILDLVGPLGLPSHIEKYDGTVICIGGGIGVAPVYPIARAFKQAGNKVISIIGARCEDLLIFEDRMQAISDSLLIATDDGSKGHKGFVTDLLKQVIETGERIAEVITIGPVVMMRAVAEVTRPYNLRTMCSLNPIMVDGTGMCGACRVTVGNDIKFACVDGPDFDAHAVDFKGLMARQRMYMTHERITPPPTEETCGGRCK